VNKRTSKRWWEAVRSGNLLPAGTPQHRDDFARHARRSAVKLAQALGFGPLPGGKFYDSLPVGDARCSEATAALYEGVERLALELFDRAVEARDLPAGTKVVPITKRRA
jgi:hypothetical protein